MLDFSRTLSLLLAATSLASAATVITYPGWRGNNLITNGTAPQNDPGTLGINTNGNGGHTFPFGMQYMYPCGGMPQSTNRSLWPSSGGAISIQPGWGANNEKSFFWINMGIQEAGQAAPPNVSLNVVPPFAVTGPNTTDSFTGQFCLPQVPMPVNATLQPGDNITIQVIQTGPWGANEYNCVDITLVDDHDPRLKTVNSNNCYNSSQLGIDLVFTTASLTSAAPAATYLSAPSTFFVLFAMFLVSAMSTLS